MCATKSYFPVKQTSKVGVSRGFGVTLCVWGLLNTEYVFGMEYVLSGREHAKEVTFLTLFCSGSYCFGVHTVLGLLSAEFDQYSDEHSNQRCVGLSTSARGGLCTACCPSAQWR